MTSPREIGELLKNARQGKGLSVEKIYKGTRIQPNIIRALEEGRADGLLSRIYVLLFLKKYARFLNLDSESLAAGYKASYAGEERQEIILEKDSLRADLELQKWVIPVAYSIAAFIVIFFILLFGINIRSSYTARKLASSIAKPVSEATGRRARAIFPIPEGEKIDLTLEATDDVWMRVKKDGKVVFEGTLKKGSAKSWSAEGRVELWVGRAEGLNWVVNKKPLGKIGEGRIRTVELSRSGLKAGNKWFFQGE